MQTTQVLILGAGAAGLMCAISAGQRKRQVIILDHASRAGNKIRISGGGRCNFTNYFIEPEAYLSNNPHFCKSALSRYTQWDFIALMEKHGLPFHEKEAGQLFSDRKAQAIVDMLLAEIQEVGAQLSLETEIYTVIKTKENQSPYRFQVTTSQGDYLCESLVVATGGLSMPALGASALGYQIAQEFGLSLVPQRAALVPFTLHPQDKAFSASLAGLSINIRAHTAEKSFQGALLFTHRGLSGPAILQISSYWQAGVPVSIHLMPDIDVLKALKEARQAHPKWELKTWLAQYWPQRLAKAWCDYQNWPASVTLSELSNLKLESYAQTIQAWVPNIAGTEGYRTAEVTLGGIDTDELSSKSMQAKQVEGLYFIGEVVDVSGHLGGFNFQWAWSSAWAAGEYV
nr:NAD(P)/FAD-dependent oxidoreductase [Allopseudospirillum japonicum]